jgi:8-oxo-dGTP pyrophosphatase MutT (NUDIX family)
MSDSEQNANQPLNKHIFNFPGHNALMGRKKRCGIILITHLERRTKLLDEGLSILIVRGCDSGIWSLPKGVKNEWETEEQCGVREMYEETGIKVVLEPDNTKLEINGNVYFFVHIDGKDMTDEDFREFECQQRISNDEIDKVSWVSFNKLKYYDCNKDLRMFQKMKTCPEVKKYVANSIYKISSIIARDLEKRLSELSM